MHGTRLELFADEQRPGRQFAAWAARLRALFWVLLLLVPCTAPAQRIGGYTVELNGAGTLTDMLAEHLEIQRHTDNANMTLPELQRLIDLTPDQIRQLLATEGFFAPVIQHSVMQQERRWIARFDIDPGRATLISKVDIRFRGHITEAADGARRRDQLRREWSLRPGQRFRQQAWTNAKSTLLKPLLTRDYPAAAIASSEARINPEQHTAELMVEIDSGPAFTFGELQIEGLERYSRNMIDALNPIHPGDPFSQEKLNELQVRLQNTGYFRSVFTTIEARPDSAERTPVLVNVTENERRRLSLGIGFSTDTGARGQVKWLDRNFLDRHWRLESELRLDQKAGLIGSNLFFLPLPSGWYPSIGANYEHAEIAGESTDKLRASARLNRLLGRSEKVWGISYYWDEQRIGSAVNNHRQALLATFGYTRRRVDAPLSPRRGHVTSLELGAGLSGVLTEENIVRALGQTTWLIPVGRRWTTILRGQIGHIEGAGRESVPADLLFRAGGDQSVRGYAFNTLGVGQNGAVVGGTVLAVASAELVYHLTSQWGAALFADAGNAADSWSDFRFKHGSGIGARWRSPIGPVNLDIAYGEEMRKWRIHFSVGYGF